MKKIAIVTGASRGLGLGTSEELAKNGYRVVMAMRTPEKFQAESLKKSGYDIVVEKLDIASEKSISDFSEKCLRDIGTPAVLINNGGIFIDDQDGGKQSVFNTQAETILTTFKTNTLGAFLLTQKLFAAMKKAGYGRVVNVSSGMGQLSDMNGGSPAYRISKTALNAVTRIFAYEAAGSDILVNSVCPGWVRTDMGGAGANRDFAQGVAGIVWAATLAKGGPTGGFFRDGKRLEW